MQVAALLSDLDCARVSGALAEGQLRLQGHLPTMEDREDLLQRLRAVPGVAAVQDEGLLLLPRPHCSTLERLEALAIPISTDQSRAPSLLGPGTQQATVPLSEGQPVTFQLIGPDFPAFIYVDYYDADGQVLHLMPNEHVPARRFEAAVPFTIGDRPGFDLRVGPPFGLDLVVALAVSEPVFPELRPTMEEAEAYLRDLEAALAGAREANDSFRSEYFYLFVLTSE